MMKIITVQAGGQWLAVPVLKIVDVVRTPPTTAIPCTAAWVTGVQNLRGRLVTSLDLCRWLELPAPENHGRMSVIVQHGTEHYSLLVARVGDVHDIADSDIRANPRTLAVGWAEISQGVVALPGIGLAIVVSVDALMAAMTAHAA